MFENVVMKTEDMYKKYIRDELNEDMVSKIEHDEQIHTYTDIMKNYVSIGKRLHKIIIAFLIGLIILTLCSINTEFEIEIPKL